jgi:hypothetical protein
MSQFFYDGQLRRYITQFIRIMSDFSYKDGKGNIIQVPTRYGDMNRQVAQILKKNSENVMPSAPFISCYIKDIKFDRPRLQDPTFVSKINIRERAFDDNNQEYLNEQGANYTVERIMPTPYILTFAADVWTSNSEQKFQLFEQIAAIFNPSLDLQTTSNYIDWTSLSVLELTDTGVWSSRQIPQGIEQDIDIMNMVFTAPIWITPPAKVKKLGIITKIINNVFALDNGVVVTDYETPGAFITFPGKSETVVVTPGNYELLVLDNVATLIAYSFINQNTGIDISNPANKISWYTLLNLYPGRFVASLSQLRLTTPSGTEVVAGMSLDPKDETRMLLNIDPDTIPANTLIDDLGNREGSPGFNISTARGTVDAIVNPETFNPTTKTAGIRYIILENINIVPEYGESEYSGPVAWKNSDNSDPQLYANDIVLWSGTAWVTIFSSSHAVDITYITNTYTGVHYKWDPTQQQWSKSFEGIYDRAAWRLVL